MVNYAVILYLQEKVGSDLLSGIGFGLCFGTSIVFGWFAGVLCDRISPTRVIHAAQALFILCLAGLWWTDAGATDQTRRRVRCCFPRFLAGVGWSFVAPARWPRWARSRAPESSSPPRHLQPAGAARLRPGAARDRGWCAAAMAGRRCSPPAWCFFVAASLMLLGTRTRGSDQSTAGAC